MNPPGALPSSGQLCTTLFIRGKYLDYRTNLRVRFNLFYIANSLNIKLEDTVEQTEPLKKNVLYRLRV